MDSKLGYGIGLRPKHFPDFLNQSSLPIDWLEIISENYMSVGGRCRKVLETLRARYPIATHGVGLSIAGPDPLDQTYLHALRELVRWLEPSLVTDHLCWTSWQGHHSYDLLPFPLHEASLQHIAARIHTVQEYLGRSMLFENPSCYIDFQSSTYSEPDFLAELCRRTGCGILLDLNNCIVNSRNLGWDPWQYLEKLRPEMVGQFHLAGHSYEPDISIDTHDHAVPEAVWQLFEQARQRFPTAAVLVEWDDKIPELETLLAELATARRRAGASAAFSAPKVVPPLAAPGRKVAGVRSLGQEQAEFFAAILEAAPAPVFVDHLVTSPAGAERGLAVYQHAYPLRLVEVLQHTYPSLLFILEDQLFAALADDYMLTQPAHHYSINYLGADLPRFLRDRTLTYDFGVPQSAIAALAAFDWTHYELFIRADELRPRLDPEAMALWDAAAWDQARLQLSSESSLLSLDWQLFDAWTAIQAEELPEPPASGSQLCLFKRLEGQIAVEVVAAAEEAFYRCLARGASLEEVVTALAAEPDETTLHAALNVLLQLARQGLLVAVDSVMT